MTSTPPGSAPAVASSVVAGLIEEAQRAEKSGRREIARRHYESALYLLRAGDGALASRIMRRVAMAYLNDGQVDAALDSVEAALAVAECVGDDDARAHALNARGGIFLHCGDLDQAEHELDLALAQATMNSDVALRAMIDANLGIIVDTRGDLHRALQHYEASLAGYMQAGLDQHLVPLLNNIGMAYMHLRDWNHADSAFANALATAEMQGDTANALLVRGNATELALLCGDLARANELCAALLEDAITLKATRSIGEASKHRGTIARRQGRIAESERYFKLAYDSAMQRQDLLLAAETAREQAELYEVEGRSRETLQALLLSHKLFTQLRAARELSNLERRVTRLEARFYDVVRKWAETIESKDPYTRGHCDRVAEYACALAREVGFDEMTMFWFRMGALLHDVGKIVVPTEVLNKNGKLSPEERDLIERHPEAGVDLLRDIEFPWDILPMIRGHHERWDGKGYPDRLAGEEIARSARVLCVADVYDALTTDRPYRKGFSRAEALAMMAADSGKMFDPELFAAFERMILAEGDVPAYTPVQSEELAAVR